ncbi:hypothetical protein QVD17_03690 [Tagetes erecta]|uniref:Uncharacterized protein n=1 Tax=Tagetes erecta TaxID=13708 RepID=A0AAD8LHZ7_TARER|nr:hypothetical protein QVD17_03690 [Tagetes erecta]
MTSKGGGAGTGGGGGGCVGGGGGCVGAGVVESIPVVAVVNALVEGVIEPVVVAEKVLVLQEQALVAVMVMVVVASSLCRGPI